MKFSPRIGNLVVIGVATFLCSCAHSGGSESAASGATRDTLPGMEGHARVVSPEEAANLKMAEELVAPLIDGIRQKNYELFSRDMTYDLRATITETVFEAMLKRFDEEYGAYEGREQLGILKQGPFLTGLWKAKFKKTPNDILVRCTIGELDGAHRIFGVWFQ